MASGKPFLVAMSLTGTDRSAEAVPVAVSVEESAVTGAASPVGGTSEAPGGGMVAGLLDDVLVSQPAKHNAAATKIKKRIELIVSHSNTRS